MSERLVIDTNLIVRYLVADHEQHAKAAAKLFEACDRGDVVLIVLPAVLCECVFVLESFYQHPREQIANTLRQLIGGRGVEVAEKAIHLDALDRYANSKLHFVDCTLAAYSVEQALPVASFDQGFRKFNDVKIAHPFRPI